MHFQTTRIKSLKFYFFTSGVVKNVFLCNSRPPESSPQNFIFSRLEWLKTCFDAFPDHLNQVLKILFCHVWSGEKRVLRHFQTTRIKSLKSFFFNVWSGLKRVWCICANFQTTRIMFLKMYFLTSGVVKNVFLCVSRPPESSP